MVCAGILLAVVAALMVPAIPALYRAHALLPLAETSRFVTPLNMTATTFIIASSRGDTQNGRFLFRCAAGMLGLYALLVAALAFVPASGGMKALVLAEASLGLVLIDLTAIVALLLRPLWSRRTYR